MSWEVSYVGTVIRRKSIQLTQSDSKRCETVGRSSDLQGLKDSCTNANLTKP